MEPHHKSAAARPAGFRHACDSCGRSYPANWTAPCQCGGMVDVMYDLERAELRDSDNPYVRFRDLLPISDARLLPSDARFTPTWHAQRLGHELGLSQLYLKNETVLPTGTTKARLADVGLAWRYEHGGGTFCTSSTGNSSTAYANAIGRFPGLKMLLFTGSDFLERAQCEVSEQVVHFAMRGATYVEACAHAAAFARQHGLPFDSGFVNSGRREGLKLVWLEAAEQVPRPIQWYVQAVSSGMGVHAAYKGARELVQLGRAKTLPRLVCAQQESCCPMVRAFADGSPVIRPEHIIDVPEGIAKALLRGDPTRAYPTMRRVVHGSRGTFAAADAHAIRAARAMVAELEGIEICFSAATAVAALAKLVRTGFIPPNHTILVNLTGRDRPPAPPQTEIVWLRRAQGKWVLEQADANAKRVWSHA